MQSATISVYKESEANTVEVSDAVAGVVEELKTHPDLAPYEISIYRNYGETIKNQLNKDFIDEYNKKNPKKLCTLSSRSTIVVIDEGKVVACKAFITSEESITRLIQTPIQ